MNARQIALCLAACVLFAGCRQDPYFSAHVELLNAEKRSLEDRVYELEYDNELKGDQIERLTTENARLMKSGGDASVLAPRGDMNRGIPDIDVGPPNIDIAPPTVEIPEENEPPDLRPPTVIPGIPTDPTGDLPGPPGQSSGRNRTPTDSVARRPQPLDIDPSDPRITHIFLNPELTGGGDWDQSPGDEGVIVAIEPRNEKGAFIPLSGPVSVVILARDEQGNGYEVARWDLDASAVNEHLHDSGSPRGIVLSLDWADKPPRQQRLHLFVRYETADGRALKADQPIVVNPPGIATHRWTPRTAPRSPAAEDEQSLDVARPEWKPWR